PATRRSSPGRDGDAAPFLGGDVAHRLGQLPAVAADVLDDAGALAVLVRLQVLDDPSAGGLGPGERLVDVRNAHLEEMGDAVAARRTAIRSGVGEHDSTVRSDA